MTTFSEMFGAVYIFENTDAHRVKVGVTINNPRDRLERINEMWQGRRVTCQICAGHRVNQGGLVPHHVVSGKRCLGGGELPLEKDVSLAEGYLEHLKETLDEVPKPQKASATVRINRLQERIEKYRNFKSPIGIWQFKIAYYCERAETVESIAHEVLEGRLDTQAPFGEVFDCTVNEAAEVVEAVLSELGLLEDARVDDELR